MIHCQLGSFCLGVIYIDIKIWYINNAFGINVPNNRMHYVCNFVYVNVFSNLSYLFMGSCFGLAQTIYLPEWDSRGYKDIDPEKKCKKFLWILSMRKLLKCKYGV